MFLLVHFDLRQMSVSLHFLRQIPIELFFQIRSMTFLLTTVRIQRFIDVVYHFFFLELYLLSGTVDNFSQVPHQLVVVAQILF